MYNQNSDLMKQEKFMLPTMIEGDFSAEELAEDADGLQMSFQRVKIPAGGTLQFEMPSDDPDNPDYEKNLVCKAGRFYQYSGYQYVGDF